MNVIKKIILVFGLIILAVNIVFAAPIDWKDEKAYFPYPVIFIHGINSNANTWQTATKNMYSYFNYPVFYQDNIAGTANGIENLDMSQIFTPGLPLGLSAGHYYWRIKVNEPNIDNYYSINGEFIIDPWYIVMGGGGGSVPIGGGGGGTTPVKGKAVDSSSLIVDRKSVSQAQNRVSGNIAGTLEIPAGAVNGEVKINVTPMTTSEKLGDYIVLGQKLYEIYPDEYAFQKACTIKYNLDGLGTDANGYGIYRYNFQVKDWDFVGADYLPADASVAGDPDTKIMSANTSQLGIYGV